MNYDTTKYYLGRLCPKQHEYQSTKLTIRRISNHSCLKCDALVSQQRRERCGRKDRFLRVRCEHCNSNFLKKQSACNDSPKHFCSRKCSCAFNHKNKKIGTRISKLEKWIQAMLIAKYPNIEFRFNRCDTIKSELDIFVPALKLAFELNGVVHYRPIYGSKKFNQIQANDRKKCILCQSNGINLYQLDTSSIKTFSPLSGQWVLDFVCEMIDNNLLHHNGA